jgi:hypothetical protein
MAWRNHLAVGDPLLRTNPAYGSQYKIQRNRAIVQGMIRLNGGRMAQYRVQSLSEDSNDPLRRDPRLMYQRTREEMSIAGRSRGRIRPAAPGQVTWKNSYWAAQNKRAAQGPFTMGGLEKQSILYRISGALSKLGGG